MLEFILILCVFSGGYVASIYSWPWIRLQANGLSSEAISLRAKAMQLENKLRSTLNV